jgi:hypothetical protein
MTKPIYKRCLAEKHKLEDHLVELRKPLRSSVSNEEGEGGI